MQMLQTKVIHRLCYQAPGSRTNVNLKKQQGSRGMMRSSWSPGKNLKKTHRQSEIDLHPKCIQISSGAAIDQPPILLLSYHMRGASLIPTGVCPIDGVACGTDHSLPHCVTPLGSAQGFGMPTRRGTRKPISIPVFACKSMWQWKGHTPALLALNLITA